MFEKPRGGPSGGLGSMPPFLPSPKQLQLTSLHQEPSQVQKPQISLPKPSLPCSTWNSKGLIQK